MACGTSCKTGGCSVLTVHDWLQDMLPPGVSTADQLYEVRFKSTRKQYYRNPEGLDLVTGDRVIVESERGWDLGMITLSGELVKLQIKKKKVPDNQIGIIQRLATDEEINALVELRDLERPMLTRARAVVASMRLDMKMSDIEYQADGAKAIFYYTAENRVDFRDLLKRLAQEFRIRIELRQIGMRQEAALLGGIGTCGRQLCCNTFLSDFKSVNTNAARYQNVSVNPSKITGLCGRLKCCLNYELDTYMDAIKGIPKVNEIRTETGVAFLQKTDIFKRVMWFSYKKDSNWVALPVARVEELAAMNKAGQKPASLLDENAPLVEPAAKNDFVDVVGQSELHLRQTPGNKKSKSGGKGRPDRGSGPDRGSRPERGNRPDRGNRPTRPDGPRPQGSDRPSSGPSRNNKRSSGSSRERGPAPSGSES